jgi:hypothetical protein
MASDYIWPLSNSTAPDEMNTSFGPRVNNNKWDFHDGIDLPGKKGVTKVHAMRAGTVYLAGPKNERFSSCHVILKVDDPNDGLMYHVYLHLDSIDPVITLGASVAQGQVIGMVGDDGANYPHLHFEFRKGTLKERGSVHPLCYLPYPDTANFSPPVADRFNRLGSLMAARLLFGANCRLEGDLKRVEVELKSGDTLLECRFVDFDNKDTVNEGNSDENIFKKDIGVEGYQKSPMHDPERLRNDLKYGILVRKIPNNCDTLIARVIDVGNNIATSAEIAVPDQVAVDEFVDFEDGAMPPDGWEAVTSTSGSGTTATNTTSAAHSGSRGMLCADDSTTETNRQRAGIEFNLLSGRFEWIAEGWFNPTELTLKPDQSVFLLHFLSGKNLSVAARIRKKNGKLLAGIAFKEADGPSKGKNSAAVIVPGVWRKWRLHLLRVGTRETTAVLYLDENGKMKEQARINWDSTTSEPTVLRTGIGFSSAGAKATVLADELRISESFIP